MRKMNIEDGEFRKNILKMLIRFEEDFRIIRCEKVTTFRSNNYVNEHEYDRLEEITRKLIRSITRIYEEDREYIEKVKIYEKNVKSSEE